MRWSELGAAWSPRVLALLRIVTALLSRSTAPRNCWDSPLPITPVRGFFVLIGWFTRPVALLLSGEMAVAYWMAHAPKAIYPAINGGDAAILFCFIFLYLAAAGPGALSVDGAASRSA